MSNIQKITFPEAFPVETINIYIPELNIGKIPLSSLSIENERIYVLPVSFKLIDGVIAKLSLISSVNWCLVTPNDFLMKDNTGQTNFSLSVDLDKLYRSNIRIDQDDTIYYKIILKVLVTIENISIKPQSKLIEIPIQVSWIKDIPNELIKKLQVDRETVAFDPIIIPNTETNPQIEEINITNPNNTRITCDIITPEWIKTEPNRLVLEANQTKKFILQIDPNKVIAGINLGRIKITNSEKDILVSVDGIAQCPAPYIKRDISISIPNTDDDYTLLLDIANVGKGVLIAEVPHSLDEPEITINYNIIEHEKVPITIPKKLMIEGQAVTKIITIRTNSDIENLKEIPIKISFTLEFPIYYPIIQSPKEQKKKKPVKKGIFLTIILMFILAIGISAVFWEFHEKPHTPKVKGKVVEKKKKNSDSLSSNNDKLQMEIVEHNKQDDNNVNIPETVEENTQEMPDNEDKVPDNNQIIQAPQEETVNSVKTPSQESVSSPIIKESKIVRISFITYPRAYVYIDGIKVVNGESDITPLYKDVQSGEYEIKIVANDDSKREWTKKLVITEDYNLIIKKGDW